MKLNRWVWLGAIAVAFVLLIYWLIPSDNQNNANGQSNFTRVVPATRMDLKVTITASGTVDPLQTVEVKSKASGEILSLPFDEGAVVKKGELLCRLDPSTVRTQYRQAEADYNVAVVTVEQRAKELERQRSLFERKLIAEADFDNTRLSHEQAKSTLIRAEAALENAKKQLDDTEVRAPINGIVLTKDVEEGQIISSGISSVSGGTLICRVAQVDTVYVRALVDEIDIGSVGVGQEAAVTADAFQDKSFRGRVLKIAPMAQAQQNVTTFEVTTLIDNREGMLKAGMNATVDITTAEAPGALAVPVDAVQTATRATRQQSGQTTGQGGGRTEGSDTARSGGEHRGMRRDGKFVLVVSGGDTSATPVQTGLSNLDYVEIREGLKEGDSVVVKPQSQMMAERQRFMDQMRSRTTVPGLGGR